MRRLLEVLYSVSSTLAALFMCAIAVLILSQTIGRPFGVVVPDANELAGFCFAAITFLALAPTFRAGGHIRVTLFTSKLAPAAQRWLEICTLVLALALVAYLAWWTVDLARGSFAYGDVSPGVLAFPLWIPQAAMAFGLIMMTLCIAEILFDVVQGKAAPYHGKEGEVNE